MSYYPIFLEMEGKTALVVGGGRVAQRKVETLLNYGASISLVSNGLTDKLKELVEYGRLLFLGEEFMEKHLDGVSLVFAATDDKHLNHRVSESARKRGLLINAVDQPSECNFIVPAIVKRGDLAIAVSTSGKSPALAKYIRQRLESQFGKEYEVFLNFMGSLRREVQSLGLSQKENSRIFHEIINSDILDAMANNDWGKVEVTLGNILPGKVDIKNCFEYGHG